MENLSSTTEGVYLITTESGTKYTLDLMENTLLRNVQSTPEELIPSGTLASFQGAYRENSHQARMRDDNKPVPLVSILTCEVGKSATFIVAGVSIHPEVTTLRFTTTVVSIEKI